MVTQPLSDSDAAALANLIDPFIVPVQSIPRSKKGELGRHEGTGWLLNHQGVPTLVTCEHVARPQAHSAIGYTCFGSEDSEGVGVGVGVESEFAKADHPIDAAIAGIAKSFVRVPHRGQLVTHELLARQRQPVPGELFYAYGFPGDDSRQFVDTQLVQGTAVFLREVELDPGVFNEPLPHPVPGFHICLAWSPERALPMNQTKGVLSLPDGMSGSPLWSTRYEEVTQQGGVWNPADARIVGMIWGHSSKVGQLYATPIDSIVRALLE